MTLCSIYLLNNENYNRVSWPCVSIDYVITQRAFHQVNNVLTFAVNFMVECPVTVRTFLNLLNITTTCLGANLIILHLDCIHALGDIQYTIHTIYIYTYISGHKWSTTHRVLKSHRSKTSIIYMLSWKQCALLVITTMALWQLMHLGTWVIHFGLVLAQWSSIGIALWRISFKSKPLNILHGKWWSN